MQCLWQNVHNSQAAAVCTRPVEAFNIIAQFSRLSHTVHSAGPLKVNSSYSFPFCACSLQTGPFAAVENGEVELQEILMVSVACCCGVIAPLGAIFCWFWCNRADRAFLGVCRSQSPARRTLASWASLLPHVLVSSAAPPTRSAALPPWGTMPAGSWRLRRRHRMLICRYAVFSLSLLGSNDYIRGQLAPAGT